MCLVGIYEGIGNGNFNILLTITGVGGVLGFWFIMRILLDFILVFGIYLEILEAYKIDTQS